MLCSCFLSWGSNSRATTDTVRVVTYHMLLPDRDTALNTPTGCWVEPKLTPSSGRFSPSAVLYLGLISSVLRVPSRRTTTRAGVAATQLFTCAPAQRWVPIWLRIAASDALTPSTETT